MKGAKIRLSPLEKEGIKGLGFPNSTPNGTQRLSHPVSPRLYFVKCNVKLQYAKKEEVPLSMHRIPLSQHRCRVAVSFHCP